MTDVSILAIDLAKGGIIDAIRERVSQRHQTLLHLPQADIPQAEIHVVNPQENT